MTDEETLPVATLAAVAARPNLAAQEIQAAYEKLESDTNLYKRFHTEVKKHRFHDEDGQVQPQGLSKRRRVASKVVDYKEGDQRFWNTKGEKLAAFEQEL